VVKPSRANVRNNYEKKMNRHYIEVVDIIVVEEMLVVLP
jgi:hypothetical protein